ncbi:hypothetical protein ACFVW8_32405 [Streptomyces sp. NPDC058221]|uniref:hypothetical protein n=1 Tax=Streptomyces sp. NPDC058221 TaxID=3346388 RepID=UPI0036E54C18
MRTTVETWREGAHVGHTHEPNEVTIQLDGLGRQLSELLPEPGAPDGSDGPVFVDESGRRSKTLRRLGWVLAAVCVCFAVTLVGAVLGGNSSAPFLPLSGQEEHKKADEVQVSPAPGASTGAPASPGATPSSSPSASVAGAAGASAPGSSAAGSSPSPGARSSASVPVTPSGHSTESAGGGGGGATTPAGDTSVSAPADGPGTPPADPETPPPDTTTPPVESPDPPVQEQEGAK